MIMKITKMMFQRLGFNMDSANTANDALAMYQKQQYDLVMLDIGLPDMNGIQLAEMMRKFENRCYISTTRIIAVTAYDFENVQRSCLVNGIDAVLNKPLKFSVLEKIINETNPVSIHYIVFIFYLSICFKLFVKRYLCIWK